MNKIDKLLQKLRNNQANVSFDEVDRLLQRCGYTSKAQGSHYVYRRNNAIAVSIPYAVPHVKASYVRLALRAIDDLLERGEVTLHD